MQAYYIYCVPYFSYYISSTSDRQALDNGGWGPLIDLTCWCHCWRREVHWCWGDLILPGSILYQHSGMWELLSSPLAMLSRATWVLPGVHHGLLSGGWRHRKTPLRLRQFWECVWQEELSSRRGSSFRAGYDSKKVSVEVCPQPTEVLDFTTLYKLVILSLETVFLLKTWSTPAHKRKFWCGSKDTGFSTSQSQVQIQSLLLFSCVTLSRVLNFSELNFHLLKQWLYLSRKAVFRIHWDCAWAND